MARRRTRLSPRFGVGAATPAPDFDVPGNLGTSPKRPPKVDEIVRHPGIVLNVEIRRRRSWPTAILALGVPALLGFAWARGRK